MGTRDAVNWFRLKCCVKCGGDLVLDDGDWLCLQCGTYYYTRLYVQTSRDDNPPQCRQLPGAEKSGIAHHGPGYLPQAGEYSRAILGWSRADLVANARTPTHSEALVGLPVVP